MNAATYTVGAPFDFGQGVAKSLVIPPGATRVHLRGPLSLPPSRPPGKLWPVVGVALGDKDRKRTKPATLTIGDKEQWRLEGPGVEGEQVGGGKVSWGGVGILDVDWSEGLMTVTFNEKILFHEEILPGNWKTEKGGLIWLGVNEGGEYSPLSGATLIVDSVDFGVAGDDGGTGGGPTPDAFAEFEKTVGAAVANLKGSLGK